jgi:hypothetical protein
MVENEKISRWVSLDDRTTSNLDTSKNIKPHRIHPVNMRNATL